MMHELENILKAYQEIDFSQRKAALATVVKLSGSGYRRPGAKMLITDDGHWTGAVSGGCLEGDVLRKAREVMRNQTAEIIVYDTIDEDNNQLGISLGCNGIVHILIEPLLPDSEKNLLEILSDISSENPVLIATVIDTKDQKKVSLGERLILKPEYINGFRDEKMADLVNEKASQILSSEKSQIVEFEDFSILFEVLTPDIQLIIFGAGYDAIALVNAGRFMGFRVNITDDCIAHISPKRFQQASCLIYSPREDFSKNLKVNKYSAAVLISHNYPYDKAALEYLLTTNIPYIGIMGPKKRGQKLVEELNVTSEWDLQRIHNPVGLDIGAETPEEIAVSIVAEIKAIFSNRTGNMLKYRNSGIHQSVNIM
jgi:xanthine/CO dehydrogenase XdhC/CoxF family maturation factor